MERETIKGDHPTVLDYRVALLETAIKDIGLSLAGIRDTLQTLASLEIRHSETRDALSRAFSNISDCDRRLDVVEKALPLLQLTSTWVRVGVIAVVGFVAAAALRVILVVH